jgi:hypothetical protein
MGKIVGENKGFTVVWYCNVQYYEVFKNNKLVATKKYRFRDVSVYLEL